MHKCDNCEKSFNQKTVAVFAKNEDPDKLVKLCSPCIIHLFGEGNIKQVFSSNRLTEAHTKVLNRAYENDFVRNATFKRIKKGVKIASTEVKNNPKYSKYYLGLLHAELLVLTESFGFVIDECLEEFYQEIE